ncbi:MAG TPA: hypothetical protein VF209_02135 [Patescibacteria group bacterium]
MHRDKNHKRKTQQDFQFWQYASNLKKAGHKTIVHALAWECPRAYHFLLQQLSEKTPLERITILLWRDYQTDVGSLEQKGYGTLSPTALRRFRDKYYSTNNLPNPKITRAVKQQELHSLIQEAQQLKLMANKFFEIDMRVWPTQTGQSLRKKHHETVLKIAKLQSQLS